MFTKQFLFWSLLFAACPAGASHSFTLKGIEINHPYAVATMPGAPTGAVYMALHNRSQRPDALIGASSPRAKRVELHVMSLAGSVMRMREVDGFDLKRDERLSMRPGSGQHLMLFELTAPLKAGERFPLTLRFRSAGSIDVTVIVEDAAPSARDRTQTGTAADHHQH